MEEESRSFQEHHQWIPQTPIKPVSPIYSTTAAEQSQSSERMRFEEEDMNGLDHLSFGDLLSLANTASSIFFSGQTTRNKGRMMQKVNDGVVESLSSNNDVVEQMMKTPEKPKRRKHRPKVIREAKPKREPKPKTPKKPVVTADGQEVKTPKRKYVRKKVEEVSNKDQETVTPVEEEAVGSTAVEEASVTAKKLCRRTLDFEEPENQEETILSPEEKQTVCGIQEPLTAPSTPAKRKRVVQSKKKEKEPVYNGGNLDEADLLAAQAAMRGQRERDVNHLSGVHYDELCGYEKTNWLYYPTYQQEMMSFNAVYSASSSVGLDKIETPKKRHTAIGHARVRNVTSINKLMEVSERLPTGSYSNSNVLVDMRAVTVSKKKPATKSEKSQTIQRPLLPYPACLSPEQLWNKTLSVEAISEQLRMLDINREYTETALIHYTVRSGGNKIILFGSGAGAIVPAPAPVRKRQARAKVDLDNETDKVWKLLLENINNEGIDGSDEQKAKWWEEERNVFRGRADSFIARMHLVQGDRRFTPWKGSVVDSVVGVFLTQNVSDHLSSSAFMSLAAAYPAPSVPSSFDVGASSVHSIRITYLDSEESITNPPVLNENSVGLDNARPEEEKTRVNSNETSRSSSEIASSANESKAHVEGRKGSSEEVDKTEQTYVVREMFPSEDSSALTYQNPKACDVPQNTEVGGGGSSSEINSGGEHCTSFVKLLQGVTPARLQGEAKEVLVADDTFSVKSVSLNTSYGDCISEVKDSKLVKGVTKSSDDSNEPCCSYQQDRDVLSCPKPEVPESSSSVLSTKDNVTETLIPDVNESTRYLDVQEGAGLEDSSCNEINPKVDATFDPKGKKVLKEKAEAFDWDSLRREAESREGKREKTSRTLDSIDWEAIRNADVSEVAETIKSRGMNHKLAERIQGFLDRLVREHGGIDLEWLRDVPPDKAKEYLLSFRGLGLKSVECVRLLTLHHLAFPVDVNVGRIAVRLGWVPLQPLPESLQLHLLEMYPVLESIQKYLWPRLCKLDQKTLYELHYQMITFGKVFCTKSKPNCNACPMRGECRHFASAFASARLALPGTEKGTGTADRNPLPPLRLPEPLHREKGSEVVKRSEPENKVVCCEPIIEEPASPEPECAPVAIGDIEDAFYEDPEEIPTIRLNMDAFTSNLKKIMEHSKGDMSTALVALTAEAASLPMPKLKNISQLRTEHQVYELPDSHPLLAEMEKREPDDPCSYLLAIWTPGETVDSVQPAVSKCISQYTGKLCDDETCFSCNNVKEARSQTVRGTILIPCRTAMRGSFPLNGTYFQVNEVFADHASSLRPIDVPRHWLWDLPRRTVYFGTSVTSIFKGLQTEIIQQCFWRGYVCVRGFERKTRAPKPLIARLHFPASKLRSQG